MFYKFALFTSLMIIIFSLQAKEMQQSPQKCGEYQVNGIVRLRDDEIKVIVHEKTLSEIVIALDKFEHGKLTPFADRPVTVSLLLERKFEHQKGYASQIVSEASLRIPAPLNPRDTGFFLLNETPCLK